MKPKKNAARQSLDRILHLLSKLNDEPIDFTQQVFLIKALTDITNSLIVAIVFEKKNLG